METRASTFEGTSNGSHEGLKCVMGSVDHERETGNKQK